MTQLCTKPFWFLRHGETEWNARHLSQGRTDIPLNETGLEQARRAGHQLADLFEKGERPFTHIVSSPLKRAFVTAEYVREAIAQRTGITLPLSDDADLQEVSFGVQEGKPMGDWYNTWINGTFVPEQGERFVTLKARGIAALNRAHDRGTGAPLIVAHGALFRGLRAAMGLEINVRLPNAVPLKATPSEENWVLEMLSA
ncbi:histidine phosphatase family protein [Bombella pollinis]|uniref:Histidine phosphatase family protein n=1 Tax=Bombella pollinis TaxID=2967337 RepID=A0ABT3WJ15_9PROT|nr:histidine phosphatase family protein [Bombella pollinis]MCX5619090.1 histidine phosphatase family protein [Bombella pollinis]